MPALPMHWWSALVSTRFRCAPEPFFAAIQLRLLLGSHSNRYDRLSGWLNLSSSASWIHSGQHAKQDIRFSAFDGRGIGQ